MSIRLVTFACLALAMSACRPATTEPTPAAAAGNASSKDAAAAASASAALDPQVTPREALEASMDRFLAARSFHASMDMQSTQPMQVEMDFVAPDRYRMQMPQATQVVIGDTMYVQAQGKTLKMPLPAGTLGTWRDPLKLQEGKEAMQVTALGSERIDGQPARKFQLRHGAPDNSEVTYWIGADDLPLQLVHAGRDESGAYTMTIRYSRFDDPSISIQPPG